MLFRSSDSKNTPHVVERETRSVPEPRGSE
jgi:hypothetical protein